MKFHNITKLDMLNGDGLRVVLWVSGCSHKCKGCQNPITWNENEGVLFDEAAMNEIREELKLEYVDGITFSGGDPLFLSNREAVGECILTLKREFPNKTIWLYTGYLWEEIKHLPFISAIDVIIDGKFVKELLDNNLHWRGSSNQRVIDVKKSLQTGEVVLKDKK